MDRKLAGDSSGAGEDLLHVLGEIKEEGLRDSEAVSFVQRESLSVGDSSSYDDR